MVGLAGGSAPRSPRDESHVMDPSSDPTNRTDDHAAPTGAASDNPDQQPADQSAPSPPPSPPSPPHSPPPSPPAAPSAPQAEHPTSPEPPGGTPEPTSAPTPPAAQQPAPQDAAPDISDADSAAMQAAMDAATGPAPDTPAPASPGPQASDLPGPAASQGPSTPDPAAQPRTPDGPRVGEAILPSRPAIRGPRKVEGGREYRSGVVVSIGPDALFIEFGPKELGVLERKHLKPDQDVPAVGSPIEVVIERFDPGESAFICSLPGAVQKADWELLQKGQIVEARVTGTNKGGLECEVANHRAFMPASQVDLRRIDDLSIFVGEKLTCEVTRVDRSGKGNIVLSRRDILKQEAKEREKELHEKLKEGDEAEGTVKKIMPFGAFVDIGGVDGLVHISDITHDRVDKVDKHLEEGQQVRVKILKLDWENGRHSLGIKQLQPDPWEESLKELAEGEIVTGRVTKLLDFGCFVEVAEGVEGLVHISELSWKRVAKTSDAVQPNNTVKVKVLKVDRDAKKISLSIKQASDPPAGAGGGPRGRRRGGKGEQEADNRKPEEILQETPEFRRLRERFKQQQGGKKKEKEQEKEAASSSQGGLGNAGGMGLGLGDLKL